MSAFKERIFDLRKQRDLTQQMLAERIGVNKQTISQYERGVRRPDLETLSELCDFFNVSADYLLGKVDVTMRYVNSDDLARLDGKPTRTLSPDESSLLDDYGKLNDLGKDRAQQYVSDLTDQEKYIIKKPQSYDKTTYSA